VDPNQIVLHGMVISPRELCTAVGAGVGRVVVDTPTEVAALATGVRQLQAVQVRVSPDVDFHEHMSVTAAPTDQTLASRSRTGTPPTRSTGH